MAKKYGVQFFGVMACALMLFSSPGASLATAAEKEDTTLIEKGTEIMVNGKAMMKTGRQRHKMRLTDSGWKMMYVGNKMIDDAKGMIIRDEPLDNSTLAAKGKILIEQGKILMNGADEIDDDEMRNKGKSMVAGGQAMIGQAQKK